MKKKSIIFGLSNGYRLAKEIAKILNVRLGEIKRIVFADSEILLYSETTVRGRQVFICQSTCKPVNDSLMELLIFVDSLKRASAGEINLIIPYFGYARQDRKSAGRQPITSSLIANLIEKAGASRVMLFDIHSQQLQGFFNIPVDDLYGGAVILREIKKYLKNEKNLVVVSPDYGGVARARKFANKLNSGIAIIDKERVSINKAISLNVLGNVKGKLALVVDDMIDTGETILKATNLLYEKGVKDVWLVATHPVFSNNSLMKLQNSKASHIFVANTIDIPNYKSYSKLHVCTIAPYLVDVIKAVDGGTSITEVYEKYTKI